VNWIITGPIDGPVCARERWVSNLSMLISSKLGVGILLAGAGVKGPHWLSGGKRAA